MLFRGRESERRELLLDHVRKGWVQREVPFSRGFTAVEAAGSAAEADEGAQAGVAPSAAAGGGRRRGMSVLDMARRLDRRNSVGGTPEPTQQQPKEHAQPQEPVYHGARVNESPLARTLRNTSLMTMRTDELSYHMALIELLARCASAPGDGGARGATGVPSDTDPIGVHQRPRADAAAGVSAASATTARARRDADDPAATLRSQVTGIVSSLVPREDVLTVLFDSGVHAALKVPFFRFLANVYGVNDDAFFILLLERCIVPDMGAVAKVEERRQREIVRGAAATAAAVAEGQGASNAATTTTSTTAAASVQSGLEADRSPAATKALSYVYNLVVPFLSKYVPTFLGARSAKLPAYGTVVDDLLNLLFLIVKLPSATRRQIGSVGELLATMARTVHPSMFLRFFSKVSLMYP